MISKKKCSGCEYYHKWKNDNNKKSGICDYHDCRVDSGDTCIYWTGIKYKRKKWKYNIKL